MSSGGIFKWNVGRIMVNKRSEQRLVVSGVSPLEVLELGVEVGVWGYISVVIH